MSTTLCALLRVFVRPRQLAGAGVAAALYAGAAAPLADWEPIAGLPGMRPALALLVVLAMLGGAPAAVGGLLGGAVIGFVAESHVGRGIGAAAVAALGGLLIGLAAWKAGWLLRHRTSPEVIEEARPGLGEVAWDCFTVGLLCGLIYSNFMAWGSELLRVHTYAYSAATLAPNHLLALAVLTLPLFMSLHPIARKARVVWEDPRGDATKVGWARAGRAVAWFSMLVSAVIGFVMYRHEASSLATLASPQTVIAHVWVCQAVFVLLGWIGVLIG